MKKKQQKNRQQLSKQQLSRPEGTGRLTERERRLRDLKQLTLLSDVFLSVVFSDTEACQHAVRILTGDPEIRLVSVRTQYVISKAVTHGARLDVLAEDTRGRVYHLEIENSDVTDHARRTRFYGAVTDGEFLRKGTGYGELPECRLFYISRKDIWKQGCAVYEVESRFRQTKKKYDDGAHLVYVNAEIDDGSRIAELMKYFRTADPDDSSEGALSERVRFLKTEEGGIEIMCEIMERIREEGKMEGEIIGRRAGLQEGRKSGLQEGRRSGLREGRRSGRLESNKRTALNLERMGMPLDSIARVVEEDASVVRQWLSRTK